MRMVLWVAVGRKEKARPEEECPRWRRRYRREPSPSSPLSRLFQGAISNPLEKEEEEEEGEEDDDPASF